MKSPLVSREAYDAVVEALAVERGRVDELTKLVATMRREGFTASKPGKVREAPDVEVESKRRAENFFVEQARTAIQRQTGVDPVTAQREAERLLHEATDMQPTGVNDVG